MRRVIQLSALLAFLCAVPRVASAQTATGQITGTIKDATGAVVPGAKVTVTSQQTGFTRDTVSNGSGDYSFALLPVGVYSVSAEQQGFQTAKQSGIQLNVTQVARIDLKLAAGATTQTIDVKASTIAVETETSSVGQVVTQRQVTQLP